MKFERLEWAPLALGLVFALGSCHGSSPPRAPDSAAGGSASPATAARVPAGALAMADAGPASVEPYVSLTTSDGAGLTLT